MLHAVHARIECNRHRSRFFLISPLHWLAQAMGYQLRPSDEGGRIIMFGILELEIGVGML